MSSIRYVISPWSPRRVVLALALLGASLLVHPARADDAGEAVQVVLDALRAGDVAAAGAGLDAAAAVVDLTTRPDLLHVVADRAYRYDVSGAAAPLEERRALASRLVGLAERAHAASVSDVRARWALADAIVVAERVGPSAGAEPWLRAAALLGEVHDAEPGDGDALGFAVCFLMEGACTAIDDRHALTKEAEAISRKAQRDHPGSEDLATTLSATQLWAAETLVDANRKAAKTALRSALDCLRPFARGDTPALRTATAWNDAVSLGRRQGFGLREAFVTRQHAIAGTDLVLDVPVSTRWGVAHSDDGKGGRFTYVTHVDREGEVRAQILFRRYAFGNDYTFVGRNAVNGDNVKKIASGVQEMSAANLFDIETGVESSRIAKGRVGRDAAGYSFSITGREREEDGRPLTLLVSCFRGEHQASYTVLVYLYGDDRDPGPELTAVLDSLRETAD